MKVAAAFLLAGCVLHGQPDAAPKPLDRDGVAALAKMLLRDSAELPMDVVVQTVVTDARGRQKRRAQSNVRFLFRGYNQQSGSWSFRSTSGLFSLRILHDSVAGNFALLDAFTALAPNKDAPVDLEIQMGRPGEPILVKAPLGDCHQFTMRSRFLYPDKRCYSAEFRVSRDPSAEFVIETFVFDIGSLPATAKINYLGDVQIQKIHAEGSLQKASLTNDAKPFLIPKQVRTTFTTDKGTIVLTNDYTLNVERPRK